MRHPHSWGTAHCLVTGAGGFLGSHLVVELARRGARTIVGLVPNKAELVSLERRGLTDKMDVWFGDVADSALMERIVARYDIDVCFHLGAVTQVRQGALDPANTFDTNIRGTWSLLEACRRQGKLKAFVGASTDKAYGDHGGAPYREDMALAATNVYDVSKACADLLMRSYHPQFGLPTVVTRCGNLYGPGDLHWGRLIPNTTRRLENGERPQIHDGAHRFTRDLLYVRDAVDAYLLLAELAAEGRPEVCGQAFNVSVEQSLTVEEIVRTLCELLGRPFDPEIRPREPQFKEIPAQTLDASRLRALGWEGRHDVRSGLTATVGWYRTLFRTGVATLQ